MKTNGKVLKLEVHFLASEIYLFSW